MGICMQIFKENTIKTWDDGFILCKDIANKINQNKDQYLIVIFLRRNKS